MITSSIIIIAIPIIYKGEAFKEGKIKIDKIVIIIRLIPVINGDFDIITFFKCTPPFFRMAIRKFAGCLFKKLLDIFKNYFIYIYIILLNHKNNNIYKKSSSSI